MRILILDAIHGVGFPTEQIADRYVTAGLAHTHGRNPEGLQTYSWDRLALSGLTEPQVQGVYEQLRHAREAAEDLGVERNPTQTAGEQ